MKIFMYSLQNEYLVSGFPLHLATAGASDSALMLTLCALQMLVLLLLLLLFALDTVLFVFSCDIVWCLWFSYQC